MIAAFRSALLALLLVLPGSVVQAEEIPLAPPQMDFNIWRDAGLVETGVIAMSLSHYIHVDTSRTWHRQILPFDDDVKNNVSATGAAISDSLLVLALALPAATQVGQGFTWEVGRRLFVYTEVLSLSLGTQSLVKYAVQRPRPYTYNDNLQVQNLANQEGKDSHLSFYSGHASTTFAAAVAGGYLFAQSTEDTNARASVWALGFGLATATSNLRVRAGRHFFSDVLAGGAAGSLIGWAVPAFHYRHRARHLISGREWAAMVAGAAVGGLISQLIPLKSDVVVPVTSPSALSVPVAARLDPVAPPLSGHGKWATPLLSTTVGF